MGLTRQFGEIKKGLVLHGHPATYPVLNERDVRAAAGIMLAFAAFSFSFAALTKQFLLLNITIILFTIEFGMRIFFNPNYAPMYALGKRIVKKQKPEWCGAIQKKFAWSMGFAMAGSMIFISIAFSIRGALPFVLCTLCIIFLWAESVFGICIGCSIYSQLIKYKVIKPEVRAACAGGSCTLPRK